MLTAQLKPARVSQGVVLSHVHVQLLRLRGMRPRIVIKETRGKLGEQGGYVRFSGGQTEPADLMQAVSLGVDAYLSKPTKSKALIDSVQAALGG